MIRINNKVVKHDTATKSLIAFGSEHLFRKGKKTLLTQTDKIVHCNVDSFDFSWNLSAMESRPV